MLDKLKQRDLLTVSPFREIPTEQSLDKEQLAHALAAAAGPIKEIWEREGAELVRFKKISLAELRESWEKRISVPVLWLVDQCQLIKTSFGQGIKQGDGDRQIMVALEAEITTTNLVCFRLAQHFPQEVPGQGVRLADNRSLFKAGVPMFLDDVFSMSPGRLIADDILSAADVPVVGAVNYYDWDKWVGLKLAVPVTGGKTMVMEKIIR